MHVMVTFRHVDPMDRSKSDFLLFRNAATDAVSLLYRRNGGAFGLLLPEVP